MPFAGGTGWGLRRPSALKERNDTRSTTKKQFGRYNTKPKPYGCILKKAEKTTMKWRYIYFPDVIASGEPSCRLSLLRKNMREQFEKLIFEPLSRTTLDASQAQRKILSGAKWITTAIPGRRVGETQKMPILETGNQTMDRHPHTTRNQPAPQEHVPNTKIQKTAPLTSIRSGRYTSI
jgi:hypothetical protein